MDLEEETDPIPEEADRAVEAERPRYYCAGSKRVDEDTGRRACNHRAVKRWYGPCPKCGNYYACLPIARGKNATSRVTLGQATMAAVKPIVYHSTGIPELDRVLGGGVVYERTLLFGAPAGSGKTTLLLQVCDGFARGGRKAYFASSEMTREACEVYAKRLGIVNESIALFGDPKGVDVEDLFDDVIAFGAKLMVIDSIQVATVSDVKADVGQVAMMDAVTNMVTSFAQERKRAAIMVGHFEKTANFAGSEKMRHLVDGLVRLDVKYAGQNSDGKPIDTGVREISMDSKSRQGRSDVTALVELTDAGIRPPSVRALRALSKLHV